MLPNIDCDLHSIVMIANNFTLSWEIQSVLSFKMDNIDNGGGEVDQKNESISYISYAYFTNSNIPHSYSLARSCKLGIHWIHCHGTHRISVTTQFPCK